MTCSLFSHLEQQRRLAAIRQESAEVKRLELEIAKHRDKCVTCATMTAESLLTQFFGRGVVVVQGEMVKR